MTEREQTQRQGPLFGVAYAGSAFLIWGFSPLYWRFLSDVPALETIMHRTLWSFVLLFPILLLQRRWQEFSGVFKNGRLFLLLMGTTGLVSLNWFIFIWAINHKHVLQASLGYYISPLINVLLGMVFLKERLRRAQTIAVILATIGVVHLTVRYGEFPWIALGLAFTFGFYGLIRKTAPVGAIVGLTVETLILSLIAVVFLSRLFVAGTGAFLNTSTPITLLLMGTALVTAVPLLLFNLGARRIHLTTLGFMQYIVPSLFFLIAVFFFKEGVSVGQIVTFLFIWTAVAIYSIDSAVQYRHRDHMLTE
ncbi:MAG: EamA family transporter RarD [Deltaproteobacteria bacterium]|nr:EamA family transporter RarD [Deltaproteobacteria bacterium]MBW2138695.1 EamA family transporter RarD [Deltaproteobacteria bacterium]